MGSSPASPSMSSALFRHVDSHLNRLTAAMEEIYGKPTNRIDAEFIQARLVSVCKISLARAGFDGGNPNRDATDDDIARLGEEIDKLIEQERKANNAS